MVNSDRKVRLLHMVLALILTGVIEWYYFGFGNIDFTVAFTTNGDGITAVLGTKDVLTGSDSLLGWPFFADFHKFQPQYSALEWIFKKVCGLFTKNAGLVFNLHIFCIPLLNVMVCYLVFLHFKVRDWLALLAALTFGFCPYVQARLPAHMALASIECIPLVLMLCIWCMEDPSFNRIGKKWHSYRRNWIALVFSWMIANNGMVYYPFFSCFIFCVIALCLFMREKNWRALLPPLIVVAEIAGWLAIGFIPTALGYILGYGNVAVAGVNRAPGLEALTYSLRIDSLFASPKGFEIPVLKDYLIRAFQYSTVQNNENGLAYMGIAAITGVLVLLLCLFSAHIRPDEENELSGRLWILSKVAIAVLLLGISTGFGTFVNMVISTIRCYNRISPFLVGTGVFALTLCAEAMLQRPQGKALKKGQLRALLTGVMIVFFSYGLWEQQGVYSYITEGTGEVTRQRYDIDEAFVRRIEQQSGEGALIYQLPYMRSFENGPVIGVPDYDHLRGLLHSDTLRWSYGADSGYENDIWYRETSKLDATALVGELHAQGFSGIWLNLSGYTAEEGEKLEAELCAAAHCEEPIRSEDGHTIYIELHDYLYYHIDSLTDEIREIYYVALPETVYDILDQVSGDEASVQYLEEILDRNGTDGETYQISFPSGDARQIHLKTPEEKGEMRSTATLLEANDFYLTDVGDYQYAGFPITIKQDTLYKVELTLAEDVDFSTAADLIVDFSAPGYDRPEQEASYFVEDGRYQYTFYFNSGEFDGDGDELDCAARAFAWNLDTFIPVESFSVTEMEVLLADGG